MTLVSSGVAEDPCLGDTARLAAMVMDLKTTPPAALSPQLALVLCELACVVEKADGDLYSVMQSFTPERLQYTAGLVWRATQGLKQVEQECQAKILELMQKFEFPAVVAPGLEDEGPLLAAPRAGDLQDLAQAPQPAPAPQAAQAVAPEDGTAAAGLMQAAAEVVVGAAATERAVAAFLRMAPLAATHPSSVAAASVAAAAQAVAIVSVASCGAGGQSASASAPSAPTAAPSAQDIAAPSPRQLAAQPPPEPPPPPQPPVAAAQQPAAASQARHSEEVLQPLRDLLQYHQKALLNEDPSCILIVQQITRLGHRSREVMRTHYTQYGKVNKVLIAHSMVKPSRDSSGQQRVRPGGLGLIAMASREGAERALAVGKDQVVAGCTIRVERFKIDEGGLTSSGSPGANAGGGGNAGGGPRLPGSDNSGSNGSNGSLGSQEEGSSGSCGRSDMVDTGSGCSDASTGALKEGSPGGSGSSGGAGGAGGEEACPEVGARGRRASLCPQRRA